MYSEIINLLPSNRIKFGEPMKNHTSFAIGGPADLMIIPESIEELRTVLEFCQNQGVDFLILGLGSNILVRDKGFRGVVIKLGKNFMNLIIGDEEIIAEAGISLKKLAEAAAEHGLSGLEFAEGIPASLGGAVFMNAGAYGGEMKDVLLGVTALDTAGNIIKYTPDEMQMTYRKSIFQLNANIVLSAVLKLQKDEKAAIQARMEDFAYRRREKQPLDFPSAGSTFKRPPHFFVGPMIEELGLKGFKIGGAQVSEKHAGFIINSGNASANDVLALISYIQEQVREHYGVELQTEIKIVGEA